MPFLLSPFSPGDKIENCSAQFLAVCWEMVTDSEGNKMTCVEAILRSWAKSSEPLLQKAFIEYAFGKVPNKVETTGLENRKTLILSYAHERADRDRQRLSNGESA